MQPQEKMTVVRLHMMEGEWSDGGDCMAEMPGCSFWNWALGKFQRAIGRIRACKDKDENKGNQQEGLEVSSKKG